jgi:predicted XRE-type DNA-binding protein
LANLSILPLSTVSVWSGPFLWVGVRVMYPHSAGLEVAGAGKQEGVAVDNVAVPVGEEGAVFVTIEGDAVEAPGGIESSRRPAVYPLRYIDLSKHMQKNPKDDERSSTKLDLARAINTCLLDRGLCQHSAAELLGVAQPKVSAIANYRLDNISVEKLIQLLTLLNLDVEIRIRPCSMKGRVHVSAA